MKPKTQSAEAVVRETKRNIRRKITAEEKIRIVLDGLKGEESIAVMCTMVGSVRCCKSGHRLKVNEKRC